MYFRLTIAEKRYIIINCIVVPTNILERYGKKIEKRYFKADRS